MCVYGACMLMLMLMFVCVCYRAIYEFVEDTKPNLLICGSRGMGAMGRAFIGSVSDYLMHNVSCTIMIVKAPEEQMESKEPMNTE